MPRPIALFRLLVLALLLGVPLLPATAAARQSTAILESRVDRLERKVGDLTRERARTGAVAFLFGAFCALWAQNTRRNPWLWFVLGVLFSVITVIVLLRKNADDARESEPPPFDLERFRKQ
ncbi:MAG: hypothetical protein ABW277_17145 [Longimicrobiaceae bacterium]